MSLRRWSYVALAGGLVLIVLGLVVRLTIVPGQKQFPDDVDTTRLYSGTLDIVNASALASGDLANAFLTDVPVEVERRVTTEQVEGELALVRSKADIIGPNGQVIIGSDDWYTIDRKTMEHVANFTSEQRVFEGREGLVVGFPIGTEPRDYPGWNGDPRTPLTLRYAGEEQRGGIDTFVFEFTTEAELIEDPATLANFPTAVPKDLIAGLAQIIELPPEVAEALPAVLPGLPDPLPLAYTYETNAKLWIDSVTGILVDVDRRDVRRAVLDLDFLPNPVPLAPVYDLSYTSPPETLAEAVEDAEDEGGRIRLFESTIPLVLMGLGVLLLVAAGTVLYFTRPKPDPLELEQAEPKANDPAAPLEGSDRV